jgi:hypothetical protein
MSEPLPALYEQWLDAEYEAERIRGLVPWNDAKPEPGEKHSS